ncbi:MAG: lytic transglycosylase domain-containing protein [Bdellovibrionota bacterium]
MIIGNKTSLRFLTIDLLVILLCYGCAGPTTPLGAPWATSSADVTNGPLSFMASIFKTSETHIRFQPSRQVLHGAAPMKIIIEDLSGIKPNYRLVVRHNGLDVTSSFLKQSETIYQDGGRRLVVKVPVVRLSAKKDHLIEVVYGGQSNFTAYSRYDVPECSAFGNSKTLISTDGFKPDPYLLGLIEESSKQMGVSPTLTAALVAQESGFDPHTVSWAKAIGLTQITPIAEDEILKTYAQWPRYPGLNTMPAPWVKLMVLSRQANEENEWRLDARRSLQGGLVFLQLLSERWSTKENQQRIKELFNNPEVAHSRLVLASYNSGYSRVWSALNRHGVNWIAAPELKEARNYVNRVFSYCHHFSEAEVIYESET